MRVAVIPSGIARDHGGAYVLEQELIVSLAALAPHAKHEFIVSGVQNPWQTRFLALAGPLSAISTARNALGRSVRKQFKQDRIDCIWYLNPYTPHLADVPYIMPVWDLQHRLQPYFPEVSARGEYERRERHFRRQLSGAARVITGTETGKGEIQLFYGIPAERIRVIPFPARTIRAEASSAGDAGQPFIFYPAQFWPHKNHLALLRALRLLRERDGLSVRLSFLGSDKGNMGHVRAKTAEFGLSEQVQFLGFVPDVELHRMYQSARALVFPSFFGPDNLPPLEAFSLGCPVIAADVSGAREQLGDAALLVPPADEVQWAAAIKRVWQDDELRQTMIGRGKARVESLTPDRYVAAVFEIIDELSRIRECWGSG